MKEKNMHFKGILIWIICAFFFLYEFFLRTVIGSYQDQIMMDLSLSLFQFSILSSTIFLLIYGLMQIPVGIITDHFGLKKSLLFACLICTISTLIMSFAPNFMVAILSRILMAIGASFGFICLLVTVNNWLPGKYRGAFIGLSQFIGVLGPMIAAGPLESFAHHPYGSWRNLFLILTIIGGSLAILILLFVENKKKQNRETIILSRPEKTSSMIMNLFKNPQPWAIAFLSACLYFTIEYFSENEGRNFLAQKNISREVASYILTISWLFYGISAPIFGAISDLIQRRKIVLIIGSLISMISTLLILYSTSQEFLILGFILLGISAGSQTIGFAIMAEQFTEKFIAVGFGLNNAVITTMGAINAPILGILLDMNKSSDIILIDDYIAVFKAFIFISLLAIIISTILIKETYCKSAVSFTILKTSS